MDDLLKRQNQAAGGGFDPEGLQGGDLNGGDGLQPKGLENDVGSGLELERGLERVAAQEAWLNEQASFFQLRIGCRVREIMIFLQVAIGQPKQPL